MSRLKFIVAAVIVWGAALIYGFWPQRPPTTTIPVKEVHQTRGLAIQETPEEQALRESVDRLSHEKPLTVLSILQAGVTFNGEIPLWGLISVLIFALIAFIRLETRAASHEKTDEERFSSVERRFTSTDSMLTEIRGDIKKLLGEHE